MLLHAGASCIHGDGHLPAVAGPEQEGSCCELSRWWAHSKMLAILNAAYGFLRFPAGNGAAWRACRIRPRTWRACGVRQCCRGSWGEGPGGAIHLPEPGRGSTRVAPLTV